MFWHSIFRGILLGKKHTLLLKAPIRKDKLFRNRDDGV